MDHPGEELGMILNIVQQVRIVALLPLPRLHLRLDSRFARGQVRPRLIEERKSSRNWVIRLLEKVGTTVWILRE